MRRPRQKRPGIELVVVNEGRPNEKRYGGDMLMHAPLGPDPEARLREIAAEIVARPAYADGEVLVLLRRSA